MEIFKELKKKKIYIEDDLHKKIGGYLNNPDVDDDSKKALSKFKEFMIDIRSKKLDDIDWGKISREEARKYYRIVRDLKNPYYHENILPRLREIAGIKGVILGWLK